MDTHPTPSAASSVLRLEGRDALDLLHRVTTQSLVDLTPGEARFTLFCDYRGRLLHRVAVALTGDRAVWLVRDDAPPDELVATLERSLFREDIRVSDLSGEWTARAVPGGVGLEAGSIREADGRLEAVQSDAGFAMVLEPSGDVGAGSDEPGRIRAGRPRHGHEIAPEFNPFEVGLAHETHLNKGCFTGQEVLMRLITYRSVRRRLARLAGSGPVPRTPNDLTRGGRAVGRLTSSAAQGVGWVALATITPAGSDSGPELEVEGRPVSALELFPATRPLGLP